MKAQRARPNVILITPHDLGDYLGCYGRAVCSPNLDRLATEGVRFAGHFCTAPLCSPARGSIITGNYPHTNGLMGLVNLGWDMPESSITDAQRFAAAGYRTLLVGFQHEKRNAEDLGFEHNIAVGYSACEAVADNAVAVLRALSGHGPTHARVTRADGSVMEEELGGADRPFYMRLGTREVHRLIQEGEPYPYGYHQYAAEGLPEAAVEIFPQWVDTPGLRFDLAGLTGAVARLDRAVGTVLAALDECGLSENTLVVFTTDHGIDFPRAKCTLYDLGLRTALIMRLPGGQGAARVVDRLTSHIDILPTMLDLCGIAPTPAVQGQSLLPLLEGSPGPWREEVFAESNTFPLNVMRGVRTERFKYIRNFHTGRRSHLFNAPASPTWRDAGNAYLFDRPGEELYDLATDPDEAHNLADMPAWAAVRQQLASRLDQWMSDTADPLLSGGILRPPDEDDIVRALPDVFSKDEHYMGMFGLGVARH